MLVEVVLQNLFLYLWATMTRNIVLLSFLIIVGVALIGRAILHYHGLVVTSWYRSPWKNSEVGGKWLSLHLIGWAYDVIPVNKAMMEVLRKWPFKVVVEADHIHLQIL